MSNLFTKIYNLTNSIEDLLEVEDSFILFIDLCDSTEFKQFCINSNMPDSIWIFRQCLFLERCSTIIKKYKGSVTKTIGDEVMATFIPTEDPVNIVKCVLDIFNIFSNIKAYNKGNFIIKSRASIDFGESYNINLSNTNIFDPIGTCVDRCARLNKEASKNEIAFSKNFYELVSEKLTNLKLNIIKKEKGLHGLGSVKYYIANIKN